jgi:hypothetical protein
MGFISLKHSLEGNDLKFMMSVDIGVIIGHHYVVCFPNFLKSNLSFASHFIRSLNIDLYLFFICFLKTQLLYEVCNV